MRRETSSARKGPVLLTISQVAEVLTASESTVRRLIADGDLRTVRISQRIIRIELTEVQRYLAEISGQR